MVWSTLWHCLSGAVHPRFAAHALYWINTTNASTIWSMHEGPPWDRPVIKTATPCLCSGLCKILYYIILLSYYCIMNMYSGYLIHHSSFFCSHILPVRCPNCIHQPFVHTFVCRCSDQTVTKSGGAMASLMVIASTQMSGCVPCRLVMTCCPPSDFSFCTRPWSTRGALITSMPSTMQR